MTDGPRPLKEGHKLKKTLPSLKLYVSCHINASGTAYVRADEYHAAKWNSETYIKEVLSKWPAGSANRTKELVEDNEKILHSTVSKKPGIKCCALTPVPCRSA